MTMAAREIQYLKREDHHVLLSSIAGTSVMTLLLNPLDVLKVRLQRQVKVNLYSTTIRHQTLYNRYKQQSLVPFSRFLPLPSHIKASETPSSSRQVLKL
jgi:hypothetical protein